jgi:hypothetical protein
VRPYEFRSEPGIGQRARDFKHELVVEELRRVLLAVITAS